MKIVYLLLFPLCILLAQVESYQYIQPLHIKESGTNNYLTNVHRFNTAKHMQENLDKKRLYWVSGLTGAFAVGTYVSQIKPWWSGEKSGFRLRYDWYDNYWKDMDKLGHFVANVHLTRLVSESFMWAGIEKYKALWIGFANSTLLYTAFELTDAGFKDWGFSVPDFVANLLGASYPLLQEFYPVMQHFNFKWSYWPSSYFHNEKYNDQPGFINYQSYEYLLHDYDGMTFWLSADVDRLLPDQFNSFWPDWLNFAVGYSASNLPQDNYEIKYREYILSFDYNLLKLPGKDPVLNTLKSVLNAVHFPAPAIKFGHNGITYYLLYF